MLLSDNIGLQSKALSDYSPHGATGFSSGPCHLLDRLPLNRVGLAFSCKNGTFSPYCPFFSTTMSFLNTLSDSQVSSYVAGTSIDRNYSSNGPL